MRLYDPEELTEEYELPPLPDEDDSEDARVLVLFRQDGDNVVLTNPVSYDDARAYASREDTHGNGWFVGFNRPCDYEAGDVY